MSYGPNRVIVLGYLGVALVIGVSASLLAVAAGRTTGRVRLVLRCLRWGVATGAVTGAVVGAMISVVAAIRAWNTSQLNLTFGLGFIGAGVGVVVSLVPTLIGAVFITERQRYRYPSSADDVQGDVTAVFGVVAGGIDVILVVVLAIGGDGLASIVNGLPFIVTGNACVLLMLWGARRSIRSPFPTL